MKTPWFNEDHEIFRKTVRKFMETELAPHAEEWEEQKDFPNWVFKRAGEMGFIGITYPEDVGGSGCDVSGDQGRVAFCFARSYGHRNVRDRCAGGAMGA